MILSFLLGWSFVEIQKLSFFSGSVRCKLNVATLPLPLHKHTNTNRVRLNCCTARVSEHIREEPSLLH